MGSGKDYPTTKELLYLLGAGVLLTAAILAPGVGIAAGQIVRWKKRYDWENSQKEWKKFNENFLRRNLKRLHEQKVIEIIQENNQEVVRLTNKGQTKYLRYRFEELSLKGNRWDGRWRLVIYDINRLKRAAQDSFRRTLKQIRFYPLQKSVYLTPYPCQQQIEYLRQYFDLGEEVLLLEVSKLENEKFFKEYFGV